MKTAILCTLIAGLSFAAGWTTHRAGTPPPLAAPDVIVTNSKQERETASQSTNPLFAAYRNVDTSESILTEREFLSEVDAIRSIGSPITSRYAYEKLFACWASIDPPAALAATERFDVHGREWRITRKAVAEKWATADTEAAFAAASDYPAVLKAWCRLDPERALRELADNRDAKVPHHRRAQRIGYCFSKLAESAPQSAADRALEFDALDDQRSALSGVYATWVRADVDQALRWAATQIDDGETYSPLMAAWIQADPAKAADQWLSKPPRYRPPGIETIIESWVQRDPHAAETWIDEKLTGHLRREADAAFVRAVAPIKIRDAVRRFESLSPAQRKILLAVNEGNQARIWIGVPGHFLKTWSRADPSAALEWAMSIQSPEERELALQALEALN